MKDETITYLFVAFCVLLIIWNISNNIALYNIIKTLTQR